MNSRAAMVVSLTVLILASGSLAYAESPINIGSRRELFVDDYLISKRDGVELRLHTPTPREIVMKHDAPWEGNACTYCTIFRDGDRIRMWYTGSTWFDKDIPAHPVYYCYAESTDGIHWTRPELGLFEFNKSRKNNIVWSAPDLDNFMVFKDLNPACRPGENYKAVSSGERGGARGLLALGSPDGLHWSALGGKPIITKGAFDTLNVAFWDSVHSCYFCYIRGFHGPGIRDIRVSTSKDFATWTDPVEIKYVDSPDEPMYTNNIAPYYRAPHIFVGFPTRYFERALSPSIYALPDPEHRKERMSSHPRFGTALTDGLFMTSRDGMTFNRWSDTFLQPGIERQHNWVYGDCYQNHGLIETAAEDPTAPPELSLYVIENHSKKLERLRRYTMRIDGFVSARAPQKGGELLTKPLVVAGSSLTLNFSTSVVGSVRVELQDANGTPLPGFTIQECNDIFGDSLDRCVGWVSKGELAILAGKPIRLRFALKDADLYSFQFK